MCVQATVRGADRLMAFDQSSHAFAAGRILGPAAKAWEFQSKAINLTVLPLYGFQLKTL